MSDTKTLTVLGKLIKRQRDNIRICEIRLAANPNADTTKALNIAMGLAKLRIEDYEELLPDERAAMKSMGVETLGASDDIDNRLLTYGELADKVFDNNYTQTKE